ncbi:unnamed protein product [marine sediment metagenome]|uniref:Uncharacterized protein n=1 Tax=marine sediment metagenome TaxID=412755 RepID=X1SJD1_9ZZZZ
MPDEPETIKYKDYILGKVDTCTLIVTHDDKGKAHIEATCASKEARDKLAAILEEEAILRVQPKVAPEPEPEPEPLPEPVPD